MKMYWILWDLKCLDRIVARRWLTKTCRVTALCCHLHESLTTKVAVRILALQYIPNFFKEGTLIRFKIFQTEYVIIEPYGISSGIDATFIIKATQGCQLTLLNPPINLPQSKETMKFKRCCKINVLFNFPEKKITHHVQFTEAKDGIFFGWLMMLVCHITRSVLAVLFNLGFEKCKYRNDATACWCWRLLSSKLQLVAKNAK